MKHSWWGLLKSPTLYYRFMCVLSPLLGCWILRDKPFSDICSSPISCNQCLKYAWQLVRCVVWGLLVPDVTPLPLQSSGQMTELLYSSVSLSIIWKQSCLPSLGVCKDKRRLPALKQDTDWSLGNHLMCTRYHVILGCPESAPRSGIEESFFLENLTKECCLPLLHILEWWITREKTLSLWWSRRH